MHKVYKILHLPLIPYVRHVRIELLRETYLACLLAELLVIVICENYRRTAFNKVPQYYKSLTHPGTGYVGHR